MFRGVNSGARSNLPRYLPILPLKAIMISLELRSEIEAVAKEFNLIKNLAQCDEDAAILEGYRAKD